MPDFSAPAKEMDFDPIPDNTLAWVILKVRGSKVATSGTKYWDCEFTVDEGQQHARRKIFQNIMDPFYPSNSDGAKDMGFLAVKRMLESGRGAGPENLGAYVTPDTDNHMLDLDGLRVAVRIAVEKGGPKNPSDPNGEKYDDKNQIKEFLSPVAEASSARKGYSELTGTSSGGTKTHQTAQTSQNGGANPLDAAPDFVASAQSQTAADPVPFP